MNIIEHLNYALDHEYDVYLSSSVFRELTLDNPRISLWIKDNVINITSTRDYNSYLYYSKNDTIKICDVSDLDTIIDIYRATNGYTPKDIKINGLIEILAQGYKLEIK